MWIYSEIHQKVPFYYWNATHKLHTQDCLLKSLIAFSRKWIKQLNGLNCQFGICNLLGTSIIKAGESHWPIKLIHTTPEIIERKREFFVYVVQSIIYSSINLITIHGKSWCVRSNFCRSTFNFVPIVKLNLFIGRPKFKSFTNNGSVCCINTN